MLLNGYGDKKMYIKQYVAAFGFAMVMALGSLSGTATAMGTPDGETPANEGVCNGLQGGTPGLYGLCVAYCEAQDLDSFDKQPPRTKILDNYNKKKIAGDPDMPCIQTPCPCWSDEELASFTDDGSVAACIGGDSADKVQMIDNAPKTKFADADITLNRERCRYIDLNTSPFIIRSFTITAEEAQGCYTAVVNACNSIP
jgi:hypothetical protein